jgi:LacI family transcriptional regulator
MNIKDKVTIDDIAISANVSISTVSRVLRGNVNVSESKRDAVLKAVKELDYQPNLFARGLVSGQSMAIGVLTQNFGSPFYDEILQGVVQGLYGTDYFPLFADGQWDPEIELDAITAMMQRQVDGLIIIGGFVSADDLFQISKRIPLIVVARHIPDLEDHCIFIDNSLAALKATKYLLELGHERIAHIGGRTGHPDASARFQGYKTALTDGGIELIEDLVVEGNFRRQSGVLAIETLLSRGISFSAIFSANDQMAYGARLGLHRRGIRVPDDLSLVGFDDEPAASFMIPPLTTVRQPAVELGLEAAKVILAHIRDEPITIPRLEAELVIRESAAFNR